MPPEYIPVINHTEIYEIYKNGVFILLLLIFFVTNSAPFFLEFCFCKLLNPAWLYKGPFSTHQGLLIVQINLHLY